MTSIQQPNNAPTNAANLSAILLETQQFPAEFKSLHLATCNVMNEPQASYAPYVEYEGCYYIFVSELSPHTHNLDKTGLSSVMFVESEVNAQHIFARKRLTLSCRAFEISRENKRFELVMTMFSNKFGKFTENLRAMQDFHLFRLEPMRGSYVSGFAKAYNLSGAGLSVITHRNETGHREAPSDAVKKEFIQA